MEDKTMTYPLPTPSLRPLLVVAESDDGVRGRGPTFWESGGELGEGRKERLETDNLSGTPPSRRGRRISSPWRMGDIVPGEEGIDDLRGTSGERGLGKIQDTLGGRGRGGDHHGRVRGHAAAGRGRGGRFAGRRRGRRRTLTEHVDSSVIAVRVRIQLPLRGADRQALDQRRSLGAGGTQHGPSNETSPVNRGQQRGLATERQAEAPPPSHEGDSPIETQPEPIHTHIPPATRPILNSFDPLDTEELDYHPHDKPYIERGPRPGYIQRFRSPAPETEAAQPQASPTPRRPLGRNPRDNPHQDPDDLMVFDDDEEGDLVEFGDE
ncbi:MAG: hypothetical protein Q9170_007175 [Blastenia crenularia]